MLAIICLSIGLPGWIACWSVISATSDKRFGIPSDEVRDYRGSVKNGELWFRVIRYTGTAWTEPFVQRIVCLDLTTGIESETGLVMPDEWALPLWIGDELYVVSRMAVYTFTGTTRNRLALLPQSSNEFHATPFVYDGRLTIIVEPAPNEFRLAHLNEGNWIDGRKILLPGCGTVWHDDPDRKAQLERDAFSLREPERQHIVPPHLSVIQYKRDFHLFVTNYEGFAAY